MASLEKEKIEWRAPEFEFSSENSSWLLISIPIALLFIAFSLWQKNFLFALLIILSEVSLFFLANSHREEYDFSLESEGLKIENRLYSWNSFESFSLDKNEGKRSFIYFLKKNISIFNLRIPAKTEDIEKIRVFLNNYLTEKEHKNSLFEEISKFLGF
ncbi:MAG: hypothetical protein PHZ25_00545 [Candidatus Pacebacteria bacterium]|nr:hypothetical protein [Candidatus Paceibacterota bacterium]